MPTKTRMENRLRSRSSRSEQLRSIVYGAAIGDALGVPYEFRDRDTFECKGMTDGGAHQVPKGTFSDDTSLMLATCDSIRARRSIDIRDMHKRFCNWLYSGKYAVDGCVFDVGSTVATALDKGSGCTHESSNGNGSLMRIAPLAPTGATDLEIEKVSAITHAHPISSEACVSFVHILRDVFEGTALEKSIPENIPEDPCFAPMENIASATRDDIQSNGYVVNTLCAALWCALNTSSYAECVLAAVNMGRDADTTACVAGALAGAIYGYDSIPESWIQQLRGKEIINGCLF